MTDEIKITKDLQDESRIFQVSIRAWLAFFMMYTVCLMSVWKIPITEPLYSGFLMGLGFYLGQKTK